jgi:hypothetical protein
MEINYLKKRKLQIFSYCYIMATLNVHNLIPGQRYIVTRRDAFNDITTFNGTFSSVGNGQIVFNRINGRPNFLSLPLNWILSVNVAVIPGMPPVLNPEINKYMGGKRRRKSIKRRNSLSGSRTRVSRVKGEHHNR